MFRIVKKAVRRAKLTGAMTRWFFRQDKKERLIGSVLTVLMREGPRGLFRRRSSALLLAAAVCALPQVLFLGMYENCDALSLFAVSAMLAFAAEGQNNAWEMRTCAALSAALSAALLSYYSVYGWILAVGVFFLVCASTDGRIEDKRRFFARRIALMVCVCLLLAGWFFLRNAWLHRRGGAKCFRSGARTDRGVDRSVLCRPARHAPDAFEISKTALSRMEQSGFLRPFDEKGAVFSG